MWDVSFGKDSITGYFREFKSVLLDNRLEILTVIHFLGYFCLRIFRYKINDLPLVNDTIKF